MSVSQKTVFNIALGLVVAGILLMIVGGIFGGKIFDFGLRDTTDISNDYTGVKSVAIEIDAGTLKIRRGAKFSVSAEDVFKKAYLCVLKDGELKIENKLTRSFVLFGNIHIGSFPWTSPKTVITVTIPEDAVLDSCAMTIGAGKIEGEDLKVKDIKITAGAGDVVISGLSAENSNLDCGVGSIRILGEITGDSKVKCGVGSIRMELEGDPEDYNYKIQVGLGSIRINDETYSGSANKSETNDGAAGSFDLDCGVGEIALDIAK